MADGPLQTAIFRLLRNLTGEQCAHIPDETLLERFLRQRDEAAFEALLCRHGPMVLNTCRRLLGRAADAEDAFQATFLVFCRKASTITRRQSVGGWLYRVASRICLQVRTAQNRRPGELDRSREPAAPAEASALEQQERSAVLDEELSRLPEKYRAPLVLHYLEGKSIEQVAQELAWPPGTVSGRLARGKEMLRRRLLRRGITLAGGVAAGLLVPDLGAVIVPDTLLRITLRAGLVFGAGQTVAPGVASARVLALVERYLRAAQFSRLRLGIVVLLTIGVTVAGAGVVLHRGRAQPEAGADGRDQSEIMVGVEEPLPAGALLRLGSTLLRHGERVAGLAYSADGRNLIAALNPNLLQTWDAATGQPRATTSITGWGVASRLLRTARAWWHCPTRA
jgi:RNA polymerase sigma factor (sigma-70 family)